MLHPNAALPVNVKRGNTKCRLSRFPIYKPLVCKSYTRLTKTNVTMDSKNMARHLIEITEKKNGQHRTNSEPLMLLSMTTPKVQLLCNLPHVLYLGVTEPFHVSRTKPYFVLG
jgi:hypothetical protein